MREYKQLLPLVISSGDCTDDFLIVETGFAPPHQHRIFAREMKRKIIGFDKDEENDWRAKLDCGHLQHVRHKPPLVSREWVLTEAERQEKLGAELDCKKCDEEKEIF